MPKKEANDDGTSKKVARTATTIYVEEKLFKKWKKRLIDEPKPGYVIVEEMMKGFLEMRPDVVEALWQVPESKKMGFYKAVEDALAGQLAKLKLLP